MKKLLNILITCGIVGCSQVNTGEIGIKTTYGKVDGAPLSAGIYWYMPGISRINILSTRIQTVNDDSQAASKDLQNVQTQFTVNYHLGVQDPTSHFVRLGADQQLIEDNIVKPAMSEAFKAVIAQFNAEELITKRDIVSSKVESVLSQKLKQYDLYVDSISVTAFNFSQVYAQAIETKQVAEQNANKAKNDLARIQVEAQQKVVEAQADAQSMALRKQSVTPELIQLKQLDIQQVWINKWNGQMPQYMLGNNANSMMMLGSNVK